MWTLLSLGQMAVFHLNIFVIVTKQLLHLLVSWKSVRTGIWI